MVNDLDDFSPAPAWWRRRLVIGAVVLAAAAAGGYAVWATTLKSDASQQLKTQAQAIARGTIRQTVTTTGTIAAQSSTNLSFQQSGRVAAVNVKLGQQVRQGDLLATLDTTDLDNALATSRANLAMAQIRLRQIEKGPTASDLAAADQAVAQAQAAYDKANNDLSTLTGPPSSADEAVAQQAVAAAQSQLEQAQAAEDKLTSGATQADIAAAQAAVTSAQTGLTSAQNSATNAQNALNSAQAALFSAETGYCAVDASMQFCAARVAPISATDAAALLLVTQSPATPVAVGVQPLFSLAASVLASSTSYASAASTAASAAAAVTSAQATLSSAQAKLSQLQAGATAGDAAAAAAQVAAAQQALDAANAKLSALLDGPTAANLSTAQSAAASAQAALRAAQAKRNDIADGATSEDISLQRTQVQLAQLQVDAAQNAVKKAQIVAPYDGSVAALNIHPGDLTGAGTGATATSNAAATVPIVLDTPDAVRLELTIGETDLASVKVGDRGVALFDGIPGQVFPFVIDSIGTAPTVSQGVVTYAAEATIASGISTGVSAPAGVSSPGAVSAPGTLSSPGRPADAPAAPAPPAKPRPGMSAQAIIQVAQHADVLLVPQVAIKRQGRESVVQVQDANGAVRTVTIQVGLTDGSNSEVVSGLNEGDKVLVPATASSSGSASGGNRGGGGIGAGIAPPANGIPGGVR